MNSKVYNKQAINNFSSGMLDIQLPRNPLAQEVVLVFNDVERDHYQDAVSKEVGRVKKLALVSKNVDMHYVQQEEDILLEDDLDKIPWIITLTMTSLPRRPRTDDQIVVEGLTYKISYVAPMNRFLDNTVRIKIYPDRSEKDPLALYSVSELPDGYFDLVYGGTPVSYAYDEEALADESLRFPWTSRPPIPEVLPDYIYIFDKEGKSATINVPHGNS